VILIDVQRYPAPNLSLSPREKDAVQRRYTENLQAYEELLQGRALLAYQDSPDKVRAAREHFEQALKLDSDYAPALAGIAMQMPTTSGTFSRIALASSGLRNVISGRQRSTLNCPQRMCLKAKSLG